MTRPLLALVGIVKNEADNIGKTLDSAKSFVDRWVILDTGSTDGTQEIVQRHMEGVPGFLGTAVFNDYASARNKVLDVQAEEIEGLLPPADFTLMLSGDETLEGGEALVEFLKEHRDETDVAFCVMRQSGTRTWPYPLVLRMGAGWRYVGEIHERPVGPLGETKPPLIPGVKVVHKPSDPERKSKRVAEVDLPLLTKMVNDESKSPEDRAHAIFFLAETYTMLARDAKPGPGGQSLTHLMAAMSLYFRYAQIAEQPDRPAYDPHKVHYALTMFYHLAEGAKLYTNEELKWRLEHLSVVSKVPETHFLLAKHAALIDVRQGLELALKAAEIAKEARENPGTEATEVGLEWQSLRLAAACAKAAKRDPYARSLARKAVEAGGPEEMMKDYA